MGVNTYRTSHHPPTPALMEACDSLGMLVLGETRLLNSSEEYAHQLSDLILRDRNHPSLFMWSIGNEEGYVQTQSNGKRNCALRCCNYRRELDPTRTSTYAADLGNVFHGINEVIPGARLSITGRSLLCLTTQDHPQSTRDGNGDGKYGIHARHLPNRFHQRIPTRSGYQCALVGIYRLKRGGQLQQTTHGIWADSSGPGFDYRGEPTPFKWPNVNSHFGVMDVCGFPKNLYYYYQSWWVDNDVIHITPHWNWKRKRRTSDRCMGKFKRR